jgi:hypothetical protein
VSHLFLIEKNDRNGRIIIDRDLAVFPSFCGSRSGDAIVAKIFKEFVGAFANR